MTFIHFINSIRGSVVASVLAVALLLTTFVVLEPTVSRSAVDEFTVSQTITGEISFITPTTDVTMDNSIAGLTGGHASGTAQVRVSTNNSTGYNMTLAFASSTAMYRNGGNGEIDNYAPAATTAPDYNFDDSEAFGQFGYTVAASTTGEISTFFMNSGSTCASGTTEDPEKCWMSPSTTPRIIINTSASTPVSGSTSTIQFRVTVPNSPSPNIPTGTYTATATLTAVTNP